MHAVTNYDLESPEQTVLVLMKPGDAPLVGGRQNLHGGGAQQSLPDLELIWPTSVLVSHAPRVLNPYFYLHANQTPTPPTL